MSKKIISSLLVIVMLAVTCSTITVPATAVTASDCIDTAHSYENGICSVCGELEVIASGECGKDIIWTLDSAGTLNVSGTGTMTDYEYDTAPWTANRDEIKKVVIDGEINNIGEYAFSRCGNITSVELGSSITSVGECAFEDCVSLTEIVIPGSVKTVCLMAFEDCAALANVIIEDGVETISGYAFYDCTALESIDIPASVTVISGSSFGYCGNLRSVNIGNGNAVIKYRAFYACKSLETVHINGASEVDLGAFSYVNSITILDTATEITDNSSLPEDTVFYGKQYSTTADYTTEKSRPFVPVDVSDDYVLTSGNISGKDSYVTYTLTKDGTLTFSGHGITGNCSFTGDSKYLYWNNYHHHIKTIVVESGIVELGCFGDCGNVTEICIPSTVKSFGWYETFKGCTAVSDIYYYGTEAEWALINAEELDDVSKQNLSNATVHFKYCPDNSDNEHSFSSEVTAPVCEEQGYTTYTCACGYEYITDYTAELGHTYSSSVLLRPTHTKTGTRKYTCSRCGDFYTEAIAKLEGHTYDAVVTVPDCEEDGYTSYTCACGDTYVSDYVDATGHSYSSEIIVPATHTEEGIETFICGCGDSFTQPVAKLEGHTYDAVITVPDCKEDGYTTYICACGDTYVSDYVDATGHSYSSEIIVPATHTKEGIITYTCVCGDSYTEAVPKDSEHNYKSQHINESTHLTEGLIEYSCACGDSYTVAIPTLPGHTYTSEIAEEPDCKNNGTRIYICGCGHSYTESIYKLGHIDDDDNSRCDRCDVAVCSHMCHKTGFMGFIWKIVLFFSKLFGASPICECGIAHY